MRLLHHIQIIATLLLQYQYDRLQKVLNAVAWVTCFIPKFGHITPVLRELHWLPVKLRAEFKIALLVFKTLNGLAPQYLSELLVVKPKTTILVKNLETLVSISPSPMLIWVSQWSQCFKIRVAQHWGGRRHISGGKTL